MLAASSHHTTSTYRQLTTVELDWTWTRYQRVKTVHLRNILVTHYLAMADRMAAKFARHLPDWLDPSEVQAEAHLAVLQTVERYDPARGLTFQTLLRHRLAGAILDAIRRQDTLTRTQRRACIHRMETLARLAQELGREPDAADLEAAGCSVDAPAPSTVRLPLRPAGDREGRWEDKAVQQRRRSPDHEWWRWLTNGMPAGLQKVIFLHHGQGHSLRETARRLNITTSEVETLLAEARQWLRERHTREEAAEMLRL